MSVTNISIFDYECLKKRRHRRQNDDFLSAWAVKQLAERLLDMNRDFKKTLIYGKKADWAPLQNTGKISDPVHMDITENTDLQTHPEFIPLAPHSLDLVISVNNLHTINDLPGVLVQLKNVLKPDGLFMAALLGGETLYELRDVLTQTEIVMKGGISPRVHPFADKQQLGALMQRAGFALPVIDSDIITVETDNLFTLIQDLRSIGETNVLNERDKRYAGKEFFIEAARMYHEKYSLPNGKIPASFEVIFLTGWSPHESQQKPMKPGSAEVDLSEIL